MQLNGVKFSPLGGPPVAGPKSVAPRNAEPLTAGQDGVSQRALSPEEFEELRAWRDRYQSSNGRVLTMPGGRPPEKIARVQAYLQGMVERLAGDDLARQTTPLVVNLYSGDTMNAAMIGHSAEAKGEKLIRGRLGVEEGKPYYEMAVNVGLLTQLQSEEELAFVLAHELAHMFESHVDPESHQDYGKRWLNGQAHEAVADNEGILRMVKAGYNPEGALALLNRLFVGEEREDAGDALRALEDAAADHHAEGVRISMAQGEIERLRRTDPTARPGRPLTPLPDFVKLDVKPHTEVRERRMKELKSEVAHIAANLLTRPEPQPWAHRDRSSYRSSETPAPPEVEALRKASYKPIASQMPSVLEAGLEAIDASAAAPQEKVDALLRLTLFLKGTFPDYGEKPPLPPAVAEKLTSFLQRHSQGPQGWKADAAVARLSVDGGTTNPLREFAYGVLLETSYGEALGPLVRGEPEWSKLMAKAPELLLVDEKTGKANDIAWLADFAYQIAKGESLGPLEPEFKTSLLEFLQRTDLTPFVDVVKDKDGSMPFLWMVNKFYNSRLAPEDSPFLQEVKAKFDPYVQPFLDFADQRLKGMLDGTRQESPENFWWLFREVAWCQEAFPQDERMARTLTDGLLGFTRRANQDAAFHPGQPLGRGLDSTSEGLIEPLTGLLSSDSLKAEDKKEIATFLLRNCPADSSFPAHGPQAEGAGVMARYLAALPKDELIEVLTRSVLSEPEEGLLSKDLGRMLDMGPVEVEPGNLTRLVEQKREAAKSAPKKGEPGYQKPRDRADKEWENALHRASAISSKMRNGLFSPLSFLGTDRDLSRQVASRMSLDDLKAVLTSVEKQKVFAEAINQVAYTGDKNVSNDGGVFLLDSLLASQKQAASLDDWYGVTERVLAQVPTAIEARSDYRQGLEAYLKPKLEALPLDQLRQWLAKPHVLDALSAETQGQLLSRLVDPSASPADLGTRVAELNEQMQLAQDHLEGFGIFRDQLAQAARLQPGTVAQVFPEIERKLGETESVVLRGLSGMVSLTRTRPAEDQIAMVEYLMGRQSKMPEFLVEATREAQSVAPVTELVSDARSELQRADVTTRVLVANSFLAGPTSFIRTAEGMKKLQSHVLKDVSPQHQELAHRIAEALIESQGSSDSLALAYVLGQRPDKEGKLSEAQVLNNLFDAYGVPGIKFKQYLSFTSEFKDFREAFSEAQDNALPLSYRQVINLINTRFKGEWPPELEIDKILGSGSVNVGVRYLNKTTGQREVISIAREDIEKSTEYDFLRFKNFLHALNKTPEDQHKFGYLLGLADVIEDSVTLEFDKTASLNMQKQVQPLYDRQVDGWNVQSIDATKAENMTIFMEEAKGKTARKTLASDPALYRSAMRAMAEVELDALLGIDQHGKAKPVPLHANPDFHDGQVLIDPETRSVTILDFGQAVPISNQQRDRAIDMLRVIAKAQGPKSSLKLLQKQVPELTAEELEPILKREDRMDMFVHLLALMAQKGHKVPIAEVHWVMAMHRQVALGEKIAMPVESMIRNLLVVKKLGGNLRLYNTLHLAKESAQRLLGSLLPGPSGAVTSTSLQQSQ